MKVFISWSGERSRRVGEIFSKYLKCIIQTCDPFFSPEMDRGTRWFTEISKELGEADAGIVCLTRENLSEPWLLFESGALSKSIERSRVCPFLLDIEPTDLTGPLSQFNASKNSREGVYELITTINKCLEKPLEKEILTTTFDIFWPKFEKEIKQIPEPKGKEKEDKPLRTNRELLEEILETVRESKREQVGLPHGDTLQPYSDPLISALGLRSSFNWIPPTRPLRVRCELDVDPEMRQEIKNQLVRNRALQIMKIVDPEDKKNQLIVDFYERLGEEKLMTIMNMEGVKRITFEEIRPV